MSDREPIDPMLLALANAPEDDEPWTDEDEAAVAEGRADFAAGRTISHDEMLRRYGGELQTVENEISPMADLPDEWKVGDDGKPALNWVAAVRRSRAGGTS